MRVVYYIGETRKTDRRGRAFKVSFAHARACRTPECSERYEEVCLSIRPYVTSISGGILSMELENSMVIISYCTLQTFRYLK
jgi:hypothetical protein